MSTTEAGSAGNSERATRVRAVVADCLRRRAQGDLVPDEVLLDAHPDLLPELAAELRVLALIERASQRAHSGAPIARSGGGAILDLAEPDSGSSAADAADFGGAEPAAGDAEPVPPDLIPGYRILRSIRRGGQGVVYEAVQDGSQRKVALKVLRDGVFASAAARRRFAREVDVAAQLRHPNIVTVLDSGVTGNHYRYYSMEYVRGLPLNKFVRRAHLGLEDALQVFADVCDAVQYAHRRGIIHRDLKPSNILVDADRVPHILDFGLAKRLTEPPETLVSLSGELLGTVPYMSPEQTHGSPDEVDTRSDVYALGVILYELLTGTYPYPVVGRLSDVLEHINHTPPAPPSRQWSRKRGARRSATGRRRARCPFDRDLETIVLRALAKEPERRYQGPNELGRDVRHWLKAEPIDARRDSPLYRLRKGCARHRPLVVAGALLMTALIVAAGFGYRSYQNAARQAQRAAADRLVAQARPWIAARTLLPQARSQLDEALRLCPEHEEAYTQRGVLAALFGLESRLEEKSVWLDQAVSDFRRAHLAAGGAPLDDTGSPAATGHGSQLALLSAANLLLLAGQSPAAAPYLRLADRLLQAGAPTGGLADAAAPPFYDVHRDPLIVSATAIAPSPAAARMEADDQATIRRALATPVSTLNPLRANGHELEITELLFDDLYRIEFVDDGELAARPNPVLVERVDVSADQRTWDLTLHGARTWHDGAPFTADDVVFSWQLHGDGEPIQSIEARDPTHVRVVFHEATATAEWTLLFHLVPQHVHAALGDRFETEFGRTPVGNGPYRLAPSDTPDVVALERWDQYAGPRPYVARIEFRVIPERGRRIQALAERAVDVVSLSGGEFCWTVNGESFRPHARKLVHPQWAYDYICWNARGTVPFFADSAVRRALTHAMDLERITQQRFGGLYSECAGIHGKDSWMSSPDVTILAHDPALARDLLDAAGWRVPSAGDGVRCRDGQRFEFTLLIPDVALDFFSLAYDLQRDLREVGVFMKIEAAPWAECLERAQLGQFEACALRVRTSPHPDQEQLRWKTGGTKNYGGYANPAVDELYEQARYASDRQFQRRCYQRIQELIYADQPYTFLWHAQTMVAIDRRLRGVQVTPLGVTGVYPGARAWWVPASGD